jgi:type II secretory pathway predicted ATPase ExeA
MYPQFFGFDKLPFRLRPDAEFLYPGHEYLRARTNVLTALRAGSRVILLTGAPGVGKTLLLEDLLGDIAGQFTLCRINQPQISAVELLQALLLQLGAPSLDANPTRSRLLTELGACIAAPGARETHPLLIVDDAQLLAGATLRAFEAILAGAPRLKILLAVQSGPRQGVDDFASRIIVSPDTRRISLSAFSAEAVKAYVERRLSLAGGGDKEIFSAEAYPLIYQHTGGAARLINVLCDAALHAACLRASGHVSAAEIHVATQDPRWPAAVARDEPAAAVPGRSVPSNDAAPTNDAQPGAAAPAHLIVSRGAEEICAWPVRAGRLSIGRASDNELRLDARFISRHHCQVMTVDNVSTIEDLGSVNGVCVNGKAVEKHVLRHEDRIMLGEHVLTYLIR